MDADQGGEILMMPGNFFLNKKNEFFLEKISQQKNLSQIFFIRVFLRAGSYASDLLIDPSMNDLFYCIGGHVA